MAPRGWSESPTTVPDRTAQARTLIGLDPAVR
jgi:hypothetical protein